jgi:hypothetical protein
VLVAVVNCAKALGELEALAQALARTLDDEAEIVGSPSEVL